MAYCSEITLTAVLDHHTFTHFHLELGIVKGQSNAHQKGFWSLPEDLKSHALPAVMKKVIRGVAEFSCLSPPI